jgi:hypothetical protein
MPFRTVLATRTRPRLMLARARFNLELPGAAGARQGNAIVKLDYANPLSTSSRAPARGAGG